MSSNGYEVKVVCKSKLVNIRFYDLFFMHHVRMICWGGVIWRGRCGGVIFYDYFSWIQEIPKLFVLKIWDEVTSI